MSLITATLLSCSVNSASAQQLASWEVTSVDAGATNPLNATTLGDNIASAYLTLGSGVSASGTADTFGGTGFNQTSLADAISAGDYISFSLTPDTGSTMRLSSISFNSGVGSAITNFHGSLLSSATGFTALNSLHNYSFSTAGAPTQVVTLSGVSELQNVTSAIEFRLYGFRGLDGTSTFRIRNLSGDDLIIQGTVTAPVPEPATYGLFGGLSALGLAAFRRRRARRMNVAG